MFSRAADDTPAARWHLGGTLRSLPVAETLARVRPLLAQAGITRVADITGLDHIGIPVVICTRPAALHLSTSQGKGITPELAEAAAIMEALEMYHAERVPPAAVVASARSLAARHRVLDPARLPRGIRWSRYSPDYAMEWIWGEELLHREPILVPRVFVTLNTTVPITDLAILEPTTNGLASGNSLLEARCHGLYEVIERDAEARWQDLPLEQRLAGLVDLETIDAPAARALLDQFKATGMTVAVWDITSDVGIPSYRCILMEGDPWRRLGHFHGSGCHLSREIALCRALTEAAQARLTVINGSRDDMFASFYEAQQIYLETKLNLPPPAIDYRESALLPLGDTFADDLMLVLKQLEQSGFDQVIAVDHTRADMGVPVVHMIVPGMQFSGNRW